VPNTSATTNSPVTGSLAGMYADTAVSAIVHALGLIHWNNAAATKVIGLPADFPSSGIGAAVAILYARYRR
jgi:5,10-methenyltetrahydromethanopterin hydrogenase